MYKVYAVTGTFHGDFFHAKSEGEARRAFHERYNGESILSVETYWKRFALFGGYREGEEDCSHRS